MNPESTPPDNNNQPPIAPSPLQQQPPQAPKTTQKGLAVTSLVLSIIGMLTGWLGIGIILALIAIILGIVSLVKKRDGKGMSIAAIIISSLTLIVAPFIVAMALVTWSGIQEAAKEADEQTMIRQEEIENNNNLEAEEEFEFTPQTSPTR